MEGHIMVEFKFNVFSIFKQHFNIHNSVVVSFRSNEIVIQTMRESGVEIKGLYTTTIPLESLEEYSFDCNLSEIKIMVTKSIIKDTVGVVGGCKSVNVVSNGVGGQVKVSFDLYEKDDRRLRKGIVINRNDEDYDGIISSRSDEIFGKLFRTPYLHYLLISRTDYKLQRNYDNVRYFKVLVKSPKAFKSQFGTESRIFISEDGTILFCYCHHSLEDDTIINQSNGVCKNYDVDEEGYEMLDYELPSKVFTYLFRFISQMGIINKNVMVNNFEILIRRCEPVDRCESKTFRIGSMTFPIMVPSAVKKGIENDRTRRREMLERNFEKRDDWSNIKPHCHALVEHEEGLMVLPEFKINHRYYHTHALFKDFEPIRLSEYFKANEVDEDKDCKSRLAVKRIAEMVRRAKLSGKHVNQRDILNEFKKLDSEIHKNLLDGKVTISI